MQRPSSATQIRYLQKSVLSRITTCQQTHYIHNSRVLQILCPIRITIRQSSSAAFTLLKAPEYVQHKLTLKENRLALESWIKSTNLQVNNRVCEILTLLESKDIENAIRMANQTKLTTQDLLLILTLMSARNLLESSLTIYNKHKLVILEDVHLISIVLQTSYNLKRYNIFEELFASYMQSKSSDLKSHFLELGLKVHLRLNPEFAKQLLYQMVYMEYPIGKELFHEFFRIARRYASFDVTRFGVDLLINNPQLEISDRTYGELVSSYIVDGNDYDLKKFFNFLLERSALNTIEIKIVSFLESLKRQKIEKVWKDVENFKKDIEDKEVLERFYDKLYLQVQEELDYPNLMIYLNMLEMDGIQNNNYKYHERICSTLAKLRDSDKILKTMEIIKDSGISLSGAYLKLFWKTLCLAHPDLTPSISSEFRDLINGMINSREAKRTLSEISHYKTSSGYKLQKLSHTNRMFYKRLLPLIENANERSDHILFNVINENIREGKRPPMFLLLEILKGYVHRKFKYTEQFISLIQDMFKTRSIEFDLLILKKDLLKSQTKESRINLINKFLYDHKDFLNYAHYNEVSLMLINLGEFQRALEYLNHGRNCVKPTQRTSINKIYIIALKALSYKLDYKGFIALLKIISKDKDALISSNDLHLIKGYAAYFRKKDDTIDLKAFDAVFADVKSKYNALVNEGRTSKDKSIKFLKQWLLLK